MCGVGCFIIYSQTAWLVILLGSREVCGVCVGVLLCGLGEGREGRRGGGTIVLS